MNEECPINPPEQITHQCYRRATAYVQHLHSQKELFVDLIKTITEAATEKPRLQLTALNIKRAILLFLGCLVTYQAFKKYAPRALSIVQKQEFLKCVEGIAQYGNFAEVCMPQCAQRVAVFIKKNPAEFLQWPADTPCTGVRLEFLAYSGLHVLELNCVRRLRVITMSS